MKSAVAVYARVSTDDQVEKQTIQTQITSCRVWAKRQSCEIVEEFCDDGVSGAVPFSERPAGSRLLQALESGRVARVVIYCIDRLSRDMESGVPAFNTLRRKSQGVDFVLQSFDDTPEGRFQFNIFMAVADYERGVIARRTVQGRLRRVRDGKYMASIPPYGYTYNQETGLLEPDPEQAEIIRRMFRWAREGTGLTTIANRLQAEGVLLPVRSAKKATKPKKTEWHTTTIWKMLTAARYIGQATYAGQEMRCPALIDQETFQAVQAGLKARSGRGCTGPHQRREYLLQHLIRCRECGSPVGGRLDVKPNGWQRASYECQQRKRYKSARAQHVRGRWSAVDVESAVIAWILRLVDDPERALQYAEITLLSAQQEAHEEARTRLRAQGELDGLEAEEQQVITYARKGWITETNMLQQLDQIRARRTELEALLKTRDEPHQGPDIGIEDLRRAFKGLRRLRDNTVTVLLWGFESLEESIRAMRRVGAEVYDTRLPMPPDWRSVIADLVACIWLESDGRITVEGILPEPSGTVERTSPRS